MREAIVADGGPPTGTGLCPSEGILGILPAVPPPLPFHERAALTLGCLLVSLAIVPRWVAGIGADRMFDDDLDTEKRIARVVTANALVARVGPYYKSGSPRF